MSGVDTIKLRAELLGAHVHVRAFQGLDEDHLALTGTLVKRVGEWQIFACVMRMGAELTNGQLQVILDQIPKAA